MPSENGKSVNDLFFDSPFFHIFPEDIHENLMENSWKFCWFLFLGDENHSQTPGSAGSQSASHQCSLAPGAL